MQLFSPRCDKGFFFESHFESSSEKKVCCDFSEVIWGEEKKKCEKGTYCHAGTHLHTRERVKRESIFCADNGTLRMKILWFPHILKHLLAWFFFVGDFARRKAGLIKGYFFVLVPPFFVGVVSKKIRWQEAVTKRGSSLEKRRKKNETQWRNLMLVNPE